MKIRINGDLMVTAEVDHLVEVLKDLGLEQKTGIAVAVNSEVIPKREWSQLKLNENDEIIIIEAAQGG